MPYDGVSAHPDFRYRVDPLTDRARPQPEQWGDGLELSAAAHHPGVEVGQVEELDVGRQCRRSTSTRPGACPSPQWRYAAG